MIRLDRLDRRSVVAATVVTLVALPSLWLTSRNDPTVAPNVATAGVDLEASAAPGPSSSAAQDAPDPLGNPGGVTWERPEFPLEPTPTTVRDRVVTIAVPSDRSDRTVLTRATYRSSVVTPETCAARGLPLGTRVTVTNVDNGHAVTCTVSVVLGNASDDVVLHTSAFAGIADLSASPVPVQVTW